MFALTLLSELLKAQRKEVVAGLARTRHGTITLSPSATASTAPTRLAQIGRSGQTHIISLTNQVRNTTSIRDSFITLAVSINWCPVTV